MCESDYRFNLTGETQIESEIVQHDSKVRVIV